MNAENAQASQAMIDCLSLLRTEWGHWTYDPNVDEIEFEDDPAGGLKDRYDSAIVTLIETSGRIDEMAQELVSNAKNLKDQP